MLTTISNSVMHRLHMSVKVSFLFSLMVTMFTTISNSFMHRLYMLEKAVFAFSLIITILTIIIAVSGPVIRPT